MRYNQEGFTLIELIVATAIFTLVALAAVGIFISGLEGQRKAFALQNTQENGRFLMESMSKEIRTSEIMTSSGSWTDLQITNAKGESITYSLNNNNLIRNGQKLNSGQVEVSGQFLVDNLDKPKQPKVTIIVKVKSTNTKPEQQSEINLQTTISSRNYE